MIDPIKPAILLTGATGFLGSHLMNALLRSGYTLIIPGRSKKNESLEVRIYKLLKWFNATEFASQINLYEIDYLKPFLGLSLEKYKTICSLTDEVIHCASDTCFSESQRERVIQFNVQLLSGILNLSRDAKVNTFTYISTAYAAGINGEFCQEKLSSATTFTNVYEESKALAEIAVSDFCQRKGIPLKIIRPTIVYGDSMTGRTLKFNAFYYPIRSLMSIRDIYLNDIKYHEGKRSNRQGIFLDKDGLLYLPLRFYLPREGGINLIPVDYFVKACQRIIEHPHGEGIYHLSNSVCSNLDQLAVFIKDFLRIKGIRVIYGKSDNGISQNAVEELFDRFIEPYRAYLSDNRIFERKNTDRITENLPVPEMSREIFQRCMNYALEVDWEERIFKEENTL